MYALPQYKEITPKNPRQERRPSGAEPRPPRPEDPTPCPEEGGGRPD